jgi:hypothetical protein
MSRGLHITDTTHIAKTPIEALEEEVPFYQTTRRGTCQKTVICIYSYTALKSKILLHKIRILLSY